MISFPLERKAFPQSKRPFPAGNQSLSGEELTRRPGNQAHVVLLNAFPQGNVEASTASGTFPIKNVISLEENNPFPGKSKIR
jgi:hypothetical protein